MLPDVLGVFINNKHVGTIRKQNGIHQFIVGKSRKPMDSNSLRALANKIDIMNGQKNGMPTL